MCNFDVQQIKWDLISSIIIEAVTRFAKQLQSSQNEEKLRKSQSWI